MAARTPEAANAAVLTDLENGAASVLLKGGVLRDAAALAFLAAATEEDDRAEQQRQPQPLAASDLAQSLAHALADL